MNSAKYPRVHPQEDLCWCNLSYHYLSSESAETFYLNLFGVQNYQELSRGEESPVDHRVSIVSNTSTWPFMAMQRLHVLSKPIGIRSIPVTSFESSPILVRFVYPLSHARFFRKRQLTTYFVHCSNTDLLIAVITIIASLLVHFFISLGWYVRCNCST